MRAPWMANQARLATAAGATSIAIVGCRAGGSSGRKNSLPMISEPTTIQEMTPDPSRTSASRCWPTSAAPCEATRLPATVGRK